MSFPGETTRLMKTDGPGSTTETSLVQHWTVWRGISSYQVNIDVFSCLIQDFCVVYPVNQELSLYGNFWSMVYAINHQFSAFWHWLWHCIFHIVQFCDNFTDLIQFIYLITLIVSLILCCLIVLFICPLISYRMRCWCCHHCWLMCYLMHCLWG